MCWPQCLIIFKCAWSVGPWTKIESPNCFQLLLFPVIYKKVPGCLYPKVVIYVYVCARDDWWFLSFMASSINWCCQQLPSPRPSMFSHWQGQHLGSIRLGVSKDGRWALNKKGKRRSMNAVPPPQSLIEGDLSAPNFVWKKKNGCVIQLLLLWSSVVRNNP